MTRSFFHIPLLALALLFPIVASAADPVPGEKVPDDGIAALSAQADCIVVARSAGTRDKAGPSIQVLKTLKGSDGPEYQTLPWKGQDEKLPLDQNKTWVLFLREVSDGVAVPEQFAVQTKGWFVADSPEMEKRVTDAIPLPAEWGQPADGLKMGLRLRKPEFKLGEEVPVEIAIQNVSDKDIILLQHRYNIYDYYEHTTFELVAGNRWMASKPATMFDEADFPRGKTLHPGQTYIHAVRLDKWPVELTARRRMETWKAATAADIFAHLPEIGISCTYDVKADGRATWWTGTIKSNTVTVQQPAK